MKKEILVVDDSAVIRRFLITLLEKNGYSVDFAKDGQEALEKIKHKNYALVTLDIEMPVMDGLEALRKIMTIKPLRVLMISSYTDDTATTTFQALELGAIDYIPKPKNALEIAKISSEILEKVKNALLVPITKVANQHTQTLYDTDISADVAMGFVLIGASTGGPRLIEKICKTLPRNYPHAICVVQHMPTEFTNNFAKRLNTLSQVEVLEAEESLGLQAGRVIIAKGGKHLHFRKKLTNFVAHLVPNSNNRFFTPSVDEMFFSALQTLPTEKILAIELTGIGDDGADGMVALRKNGAYTIAESEKSAVVYGMPKEAAIRGGAKKVLDFDDIVKEILSYGQ